MTVYFARYIDSACRARHSDDGSPALKPVSLERGVLADLPLPGRENAPVTRYAAAAPAARARPWFFDEPSARGAQAFAAVDWNAATAMPMVTAVENCMVNPFSFNSVATLTITTDSDFAIKPILLGAIPTPFVGTGASLARPSVELALEWICGPYVPLGDGRFRVSLDRTWKTGAASYMAVRQDSAPGLRFGVQPISVRLDENKVGAAQTIHFEPIPDVRLDTKSLVLLADSDAGLPVSFFVVAGPAIVKGDQLEFTSVPPRTKFPLEVTVAAWQWGCHRDPKIKAAEIVQRTFRLLR